MITFTLAIEIIFRSPNKIRSIQVFFFKPEIQEETKIFQVHLMRRILPLRNNQEPCFKIFPQVSRSVTVRLKTGTPSGRGWSAQK